MEYLDIATGMVVGTKTWVNFIPAITIECVPPYIKGKRDGCWARVNGIDVTNKSACERAVGMSLMPLG